VRYEQGSRQAVEETALWQNLWVKERTTDEAAVKKYKSNRRVRCAGRCRKCVRLSSAPAATRYESRYAT
jgi:hypothetical protein